LAALIAIVAAGSDATIQSIGDYTLLWLVFAVVPARIVFAAIVIRWRAMGRAELAGRTARCDSLLWLGPFLALGLCSPKIRAFLVPPAVPADDGPVAA
jgi:hypothetical protein